MVGHWWRVVHHWIDHHLFCLFPLNNIFPAWNDVGETSSAILIKSCALASGRQDVEISRSDCRCECRWGERYKETALANFTPKSGLNDKRNQFSSSRLDIVHWRMNWNNNWRLSSIVPVGSKRIIITTWKYATFRLNYSFNINIMTYYRCCCWWWSSSGFLGAKMALSSNSSSSNINRWIPKLERRRRPFDGEQTLMAVVDVVHVVVVVTVSVEMEEPSVSVNVPKKRGSTVSDICLSSPPVLADAFGSWNELSNW